MDAKKNIKHKRIKKRMVTRRWIKEKEMMNILVLGINPYLASSGMALIKMMKNSWREAMYRGIFTKGQTYLPP